MTKTWAMALGAGYVVTACTGCAVYLALQGHPGANLEALGVGASEQEVERQLGTPFSVEPLGAGKRLSRYRVELTKQPNQLRSLTHLVLDLVTIGIWELPGSIYEMNKERRKGEVGIVYGADDRVLEIQDYQAIQALAAGETVQSAQELWQAFWNDLNK